MMNVIEVQEALKGMPMEQLVREMQTPSGQAPQFLVLSEITRRREMEKEYAQRQQAPQTTVAQDAVAAAGVPQGGIADMARAMAPRTDMTMNTGASQAPVQGMARGGYVQKMQAGGPVVRGGMIIDNPPEQFLMDPSMIQMASMMGMTPEQYWRSLSPESRRAQLELYDQQRPGLTQNPFQDRALRMYDPSRPSPGMVDLDAAAEAESIYKPIRERREAQAGRMTGFEPVGGGLSDLMGSSSYARPEFAGELPEAGSVYDEPMAAEDLLAASAGPAIELPSPDRTTTAEDIFGGRVGFNTAPAPVPLGAGTGRMEAAGRAGAGAPVEGGSSGAGAGRLEAINQALIDNTMMDTGDPLSIGVGGIDALMPPAAAAPVVTPEAPDEAPDVARDTGGVGGAGGIAAAISPLETELSSMLQRRERQAEQDKWLALAQAGMTLMSSREPNIAGAIGEAGLVGLEQFRSARDQYEKDRLQLMTAQEQLRGSRAAAVARASAAQKRQSLKPSDISTYYQRRADILKQMSESFDEEYKELLRRELIKLEMDFRASSGSVFDAADTGEG